VSITAVAFVPAAPLLVPQVAGGSAALDEPMRAASLDAVARALDPRPAEVVVVAPTTATGEWAADATWDFAGFGVARADPRPVLPWSLGIGAWLLDEVGWDGRRRYVGVSAAGDGTAGAPVSAEEAATVVIAVADGSACRTERAPGYLDDRAESFDEAIATLLARGDAAGLGSLEDTLAGELLCTGLPVWRWVSAAVAGVEVTTADLSMHVAPYGVGYFVARWSLAG
jgi:hypothetical protein